MKISCRLNSCVILRFFVKRPEGTSYKVLVSVDSGGFNVIISAYIFIELEDTIKRHILANVPELLPESNHIKSIEDFEISLADFVDCFAGTSGGSWASLYLASKGGNGIAANIFNEKRFVEKYGKIAPGAARGLLVLYNEYGNGLFPQELINAFNSNTNLDPTDPGQLTPAISEREAESVFLGFYGRTALSELSTSCMITGYDLITRSPILFVHDKFGSTAKTGFTRLIRRSSPRSRNMTFMNDIQGNYGLDYFISDVAIASSSSPMRISARVVLPARGEADRLIIVDGAGYRVDPSLIAFTHIANSTGAESYSDIAILSITSGFPLPSLINTANRGEVQHLNSSQQRDYSFYNLIEVYNKQLELFYYSDSVVKPGQYLRIQLYGHPGTELNTILNDGFLFTRLPELSVVGQQLAATYRQSIESFVSMDILSRTGALAHEPNEMNTRGHGLFGLFAPSKIQQLEEDVQKLNDLLRDEVRHTAQVEKQMEEMMKMLTDIQQTILVETPQDLEEEHAYEAPKIREPKNESLEYEEFSLRSYIAMMWQYVYERVYWMSALLWDVCYHPVYAMQELLSWSFTPWMINFGCVIIGFIVLNLVVAGVRRIGAIVNGILSLVKWFFTLPVFQTIIDLVQWVLNFSPKRTKQSEDRIMAKEIEKRFERMEKLLTAQSKMLQQQQFPPIKPFSGQHPGMHPNRPKNNVNKGPAKQFRYKGPIRRANEIRCDMCNAFGHTAENCMNANIINRDISSLKDDPHSSVNEINDTAVLMNEIINQADYEWDKCRDSESDFEVASNAPVGLVTVNVVNKQDKRLLSKHLKQDFLLHSKLNSPTKMRALIDTGSCVNLLSEKMLRKLGYTLNDLWKPNEPLMLHSFNGKKTKTLGHLEIRTRLGRSFCDLIYVVTPEELANPIIGIPGLNQLELIIDCAGRSHVPNLGQIVESLQQWKQKAQHCKQDMLLDWKKINQKARTVWKKITQKGVSLALGNSFDSFELKVDWSGIHRGFILYGKKMGKSTIVAVGSEKDPSPFQSSFLGELQTAKWGLLKTQHLRGSVETTVFIDNQAVVSALKKGIESFSNDRRCTRIFAWICGNERFCSFSFLPGTINQVADQLSRLNPPVVEKKTQIGWIENQIPERPDTPTRNKILSEGHLGHWSYEKTKKNIEMQYGKWPGMDQDVREFCRKCKQCQFHGGLQVRDNFSEDSVEYINDRVFADWAGPLTTSSGEKRYLLIVVDAASRWLEVANAPSPSAARCVDALQKWTAKTHSFIKTLVTDNAQIWSSVMVKNWARNNNTNIRSSPSYFPRGVNLAERMVGTLAGRLKKMSDPFPGDWSRYLEAAVATINKSWHRALQTSPFELFYGQDRTGRWIPASEWFEAWERARQATRRSKQEEQDHFFKKHRRFSRSFAAGNQVLLLDPLFASRRPYGKLNRKWLGPLVVHSQNSQTTWWIWNPDFGSVFLAHSSQLRLFVH
eukprot:g4257.t1